MNRPYFAKQFAAYALPSGYAIEHSVRMAKLFTDPTLQVVAYLHDVLEDSQARLFGAYLWLDARSFALTDGELWALVALTRGPDEAYRTYIQRVSRSPVASAVKRADLEDHLTHSPKKSLVGRYTAALDFLRNPLDSPGYVS